MTKPIRSRVVRLNLKGVVYFITALTYQRRPIFADDNRVAILRETMREAQIHHPFGMKGYVILPDHCHLLLQLKGETDISKLMHSIKRNFTRNVKHQEGIIEPTKLWHRSFHDHVIRDERDFYNHLHYIHYNPVKHGLTTRPETYAHSSYREYVSRGWYEIGWGHQDQPFDAPGGSHLTQDP
ncbi:MAG: transposase [Anaerolineae bacterium]|nr:transposase [Anaerolineae bacterium]MCO5194431.1 transposase [Anaerolineae bacterium]MCO5199257.1 transposase [Anaerolineae bacterium]